MVTNQELADRALLIARDALDSLVEFGRESGASDDTAIEASVLLGERPRPTSNGRRDRRATMEGFLANDLLLGVAYALRERDPAERERIDPLEADYLLNDGDEAGALAAADAMIRAAETVDGDYWNDDDLLHHGHIVRGTIFLRRGETQAAASELLAAASAPRPSGRPDLELALGLVQAGEDETVLTYLRAVAPWW